VRYSASNGMSFSIESFGIHFASMYIGRQQENSRIKIGLEIKSRYLRAVATKSVAFAIC
jgi:hypothetical protein